MYRGFGYENWPYNKHYPTRLLPPGSVVFPGNGNVIRNIALWQQPYHWEDLIP